MRHITGKISKKYRADVPIIIKLDSGFFDTKLFDVIKELHIGNICNRMLYGEYQ